MLLRKKEIDAAFVINRFLRAEHFLVLFCTYENKALGTPIFLYLLKKLPWTQTANNRQKLEKTLRTKLIQKTTKTAN